jgi:tetratricopeptide (TPR) repeat protein
MDSDDTIDEQNGRRLRELADGQHPSNVLGYVIQVHCPGPHIHGEIDCTVVDHVKLIRNLPNLKFDGRIHEQVLPAIRQLGGDIAWTDIHVVHSGSDQSPAGRKRKQERDLHILLLELQERPAHPFTLFNLGMTYADMEDYEHAIEYLNRSIAVSDVAESHLRKAYALLVNSFAQLKQFDAAARTCAQGRTLFADDPELLFRHGILAHHTGRLQEAEGAYRQLLQYRGERHFSSMDPGILGFKARHNLAAVYQDMGRGDLAELQWRCVIREMPTYRLGWRGLLACLLRLRRFQTTAIEIERMLSLAELRSTALVMKAQLALLHGDLSRAKQDILAAIQDYPDEFEPLEALCRFLFEHGEPYEAKLALQELSTRLPNDGSVLHNLGVVNVRLGQYAAAVEAYESSVRVRPDSAATYRELASALSALGKADESQAAFREADRLGLATGH